MKDQEFYGGSGKHPMGGAEMIKIDGQWYEKTLIDYIKSQSKPVSSPKKVQSDSHISDQRERLTLLKSNRARLQKQIDSMNKIINYIEQDLGL